MSEHVKKVFKVVYEGDNPPTKEEITEALLNENMDDLGALTVREIGVKEKVTFT